MLMTIAPGLLLTILCVTLNAIILVMALMGQLSTGVAVASSASSLLFCLLNYLLIMFLFGALTTFTEWDNIRADRGMKIRSMFTFPFFMITYIPIAIVALFKKADWKPIKHSISVNVDEFAQAQSAVDKQK